MEILTFHYANDVIRQVAVSDWYCKPSILHSLACKFGVLFITTEKYGCRQFVPHWCTSFPVHNVEFICYKHNLPWIVIEFNNCAHEYMNPKYLEQLDKYY